VGDPDDYMEQLTDDNQVDPTGAAGSGGSAGFSPGNPGTAGVGGTAVKFRLVEP
jgi:hypothetical protein